MCRVTTWKESKAFKSITYASEYRPIREWILSKLGQPIITKEDVYLSDVVPVIAPDHNGEETYTP